MFRCVDTFHSTAISPKETLVPSSLMMWFVKFVFGIVYGSIRPE